MSLSAAHAAVAVGRSLVPADTLPRVLRKAARIRASTVPSCARWPALSRF